MSLLRDGEVVDPIPLPAGIVVLGAERSFLPITDSLDPVCRDSLLQQRLLQRLCAAGSQRQVVFFRAAIVTMSFDHYLDRRMLCQERRIARGCRALIGADLCFVVVEQNVFHVLGEQIFVARRRCRSRRRHVHRYPGCSILCTSWSFGDQSVSGGTAWGNRL